MKFNDDCSGNVLFLILIAVALFAALSYAVTSSTRSGGGSASRESSVIRGAQVAQGLTGIHQAIMRMNVGGTAYSDLQFWDGNSCIHNSTLCSSGKNCVFAPDGGKAVIPAIPKDIIETAGGGAGLPGQPSTAGTTNIWIDCDADMTNWGFGTSLPERAMYITKVTRNACLAFNKGLGIEGIPGDDLPASAERGLYSACTRKGSGQYDIFQILYVQ